MMRIALKGPFDTKELRRLADTIVKQRLETLNGVAAARVVGGAEEEVHVDLEDERLTALGLPFDEVTRRIGEENVNRSGGELRDQETAYRLRTVNEFETLEEIADTIVRSSDGGVIRVRDIGTVRSATDDREVRVRVDGVPAVQLHIYKEGDANAVQVARAVRSRLDSTSSRPIKVPRRAASLAGALRPGALHRGSGGRTCKATALLGALLAAHRAPTCFCVTSSRRTFDHRALDSDLGGGDLPPHAPLRHHPERHVAGRDWPSASECWSTTPSSCSRRSPGSGNAEEGHPRLRWSAGTRRGAGRHLRLDPHHDLVSFYPWSSSRGLPGRSSTTRP